MNKTIISVIAVLVVLGGIYYFSIQKGPNAIFEQVPATSESQEVVAIDIQDFAFKPAALTVKVGTKVVWTNRDAVGHTVTSDTGTLLDSALLSTDQSFEYVFTEKGSYSYHCAPHPKMKGTIIVE